MQLLFYNLKLNFINSCYNKKNIMPPKKDKKELKALYDDI